MLERFKNSNTPDGVRHFKVKGYKMRLSLEKVLVLKNISAFADVSESALSDFIYASEEIAFPKGKDIIKKGEVNKYLYILLAGIVQVHDGDTILSEAQTQEMFGEMTALCPSQIDATVTAVQDTLALRISSENLYEMMTLHPNISKGIIKTLVSRLKVLDNRHI